MIKVLVVEDSVTQREIICRVVCSDTHMTVVGEARNGVEAVAKSRELMPDVVLMDVHMPEMNGIEAAREIMRDLPTPIVIMSSTLQKRDIDLAVDAMRVGAVGVIEKPKGAALLNMAKMAPKLCQMLRDAAGTKVGKPSPRSARPAERLTDYVVPSWPIKVIAVVSSAGGPSTLVELFSRLPPHFPIPILLVQHISSGFETGFAEWLTRQTGQSATIATDHQRLLPGIWLGPKDHHIVLKSRNLVGLLPRRPADIHCPGGDPLLSSVAALMGRAAVGAVLTGMGDDGAQGLLALKQAGGQTMIQDEATSMVWGMPQAAKKIDAHIYEMNPSEIGDALARLVTA